MAAAETKDKAKKGIEHRQSPKSHCRAIHRLVLYQEQEPNLESMVFGFCYSSPAIFCLIYRMSLTVTRSKNGSRLYFFIVLIDTSGTLHKRVFHCAENCELIEINNRLVSHFRKKIGLGLGSTNLMHNVTSYIEIAVFVLSLIFVDFSQCSF